MCVCERETEDGHVEVKRQLLGVGSVYHGLRDWTQVVQLMASYFTQDNLTGFLCL